MKKLLLATILGFALALTGTAGAADNGKISNGYVKIGVLTDMSSVYKDLSGPGSVTAVKMAIKDFGGEVLGMPIKLITGNHQNKASLASSIARKWIDRKHVDVIVDLVNSAAALAGQETASEKHVITITTGAATTQLTEGQCTKYGIHYVYDTYSQPAGTATAIVKNGGKTWFFIYADYAYGHSVLKIATKIITSLGGKVLGSVAAPIGTTDFSSYLIQAKSSGAEVIGLGNAGADTVNSIKQAHSFGITQGGQKLAGMVVFITDIKALGLKTAQGLRFTSAFYWNQSDAARKWSKRFFDKHGAMPTMVQAGDYSATLAYLKAIQKAGTDDADAVRTVLGHMTINDMFVKGGHIEPNGLMRHDMYLVKVKSPTESKGPWNLLKVIGKIPGKQAFIPLSKSQCPLVHNPS